jgi:hypothetical protein
MRSMNDWTREHFQPGGGDPFLFYVVYGPTPTDFTISRETYRCEGVPDGLDVMAYSPKTHPDVVHSFCEGYLWDVLLDENPELAQAVKQQKECLIFSGDIADPADLGYFRDTIGVISWLVDQGAVAVYDPQMIKWWSAEEWREHVFKPSEAGPDPLAHVVILVSAEPQGTDWFHTRGMRKYGRPDISVPGVTREHRKAVVELIERFIHFQAMGGVIEEGREVNMKSLPEGMTCHHKGDLDDPDFNNVHVEITRPGAKLILK